MKNKSFVFNSFLAFSIILGTFLINSCTKEEFKSELQKTDISVTGLFNKSDAEITKMIKTFEDNIVDEKKSGISLKFDESILLMEALFNYKYGHVGGNYIHKFLDTVIIETKYSKENNVPARVLFQYLKEINLSIYNAYMDCEYPNKKVKYIDLEIEENSEDGSKLIAYTLIGNQESKKSVQAGGLPVNLIEWPGETPFNSEQDQEWRTVHHQFEYPGGFFNNTTAAIALKEKLVIDKDPPTSTYWYGITTISTFDIYNHEYADYYEYNSDIADPTELLSNIPNPEYVSTFFHVFYGTWDYNAGYGVYNEEISNPGIYNADYRQMNKLYNVCLIFMDYYKPSNKEIIDYDYGSNEQHYHNYGNPYAEMTGMIKLTYGIHLNDDGSIPQNPTFPWKP